MLFDNPTTHRIERKEKKMDRLQEAFDILGRAIENETKEWKDTINSVLAMVSSILRSLTGGECWLEDTNSSSSKDYLFVWLLANPGRRVGIVDVAKKTCYIQRGLTPHALNMLLAWLKISIRTEVLDEDQFNKRFEKLLE